MKMTDLRAKARAIFGPAFAEPMPNQPNGAKALQQRANARPIPTYKVGGPVKKPMPTPAASAASGNRMSREEADEMRFMDMMDKKKKSAMPSPAASAASGNRMAREEGAEMRKMKMKTGGKVQTSSDTARKLASEMGGMKKGGKVKPVELDMKMLEEASRPRASLPNLESMASEARSVNTARAKETSDAAKKQSFKEAFAEARRDQGPNGVFTWRGNTYNTKMAGETSKGAPARAAAPTPARAAAPAAAPPPTRAATPTPTPTPTAARATPANNANKDLKALADKIQQERKDSFTKRPLTDAEALEEAGKQRIAPPSVTGGYADRGARVLEERKKRAAQNAATEAARVKKPSLFGRMYDATMNPGVEQNYAKGGKVKEPKPKNGLAVMIAIGKPMKPAKKMNGGPMAGGSMDREASKVTREMAMGGDPMGYMGGGSPMGYAAGGAGKTRKGQAPIKKAQGGAAKVRKGMMTPEGDIINVMNKMRGK
jgi:hypothetical protein